MKRILAILLLVLLLPVSLLAVGAAMPEYYGETYYAELSEFYSRLKTVRGKKLVIVGGSNVAFGVDTAQLETTLRDCGYEYTVCPFGLYAAVGTSVMLDMSEAYLNEGDVVVLAIEPTAETFSTYFGATAFWKCAERAPEMLLELRGDKRGAAVGNYITYLQERAGIGRSGILPRAEGAYARAAFDEVCNMSFDRAGNTMILGYDPAHPIDLAAIQMEDAFVQQVNHYCQRAGQKGAEVVMSFSPMNRGALTDASEETIYRYFSMLQEAFCCQIISDPHDYVMDSGWFYDNNFHLNTPGAAIRTYTLACDLLSYLGCYQEIPFHPPEMPSSIAEQPREGEDASDFQFTPVGEDGCSIAGLTERGRVKTDLTVPTDWEGKTVVSFTADTFAGNRVLERLTLPETIGSIPDGAFDGCTSLTRLTLLHRSAPPAIGDAPFAGAERLQIYIPSASFVLYRDGAGCEANPWERYLSRIEPY